MSFSNSLTLENSCRFDVDWYNHCDRNLFIMKPIKLPVKTKKGAILALEKSQSLARKEKDYDCVLFSELWPEILKDMVKGKKAGDLTYGKLWKKYRSRLADIYSLRQFIKRLADTGMTLSAVAKTTSVKEQVQVAIKQFADVKKEHAESHMRRIHTKLEKIHKVVEEMPVNDKNVSFTLDLVSRLHKEGRIAYGIDDDSAPDKKVTNLAIMIGWTPTEKAVQVKEIQ